jgi:hypothetical protein
MAVWKPYLSPVTSLAILLVFGFSYIMLYFRKMNEVWFAVSVLLMILVDLSSKDIQLLPLIDRKHYEAKPLVQDILEGSLGKHRIYSGKLQKKPGDNNYPGSPTRLAGIRAGKELLYPYMGMVYGVEHVNGFTGLALELQSNMVWWSVFVNSPPERRKRILTRSNVKYWIDGDRQLLYSEGYPVILPNRVQVLNGTLPRAYLVPKMRLPEQGNHPLNIYYDESFDPYKEVLLSWMVDFKPSDQFSGKVKQVVYKPNHVTVQTTQEGNGFLVLLDTFFPGWTVKVDGQTQPILRANYFYRAVQLGPGEHTVEFDFLPEGMRMGLMVSGISLFLIVFGALFLRKPMERLIWKEKDVTP